MLEVEDLTKYYGETRAVNDISFKIKEGDFVTLLGPSGCGKSTILHIIAGFLQPTEGSIYLRNEEVTDKPPNKRNIGMSFQSTALFPHMSVRENIAYGLKMRTHSPQSNQDRVDEILDLIDLPGHGENKPSELSGGQQQRVSLGRAIAFEPDILLLDEPLTGLDRVLREDMRSWLKKIQETTDVTMLYVTHDQADALSMSDEVVVLNNGEIQQIDDPKTIYERPSNKFTAEFVGKSTKLQGSVSQNGKMKQIQIGDLTIEINSQRGRMLEDDHSGESVTAYIRPEDVEIVSDSTDGSNCFSGSAKEILDKGDRSEVTVGVDEIGDVLVYTGRFPNFSIGDEVEITIPEHKVIIA